MLGLNHVLSRPGRNHSVEALSRVFHKLHTRSQHKLWSIACADGCLEAADPQSGCPQLQQDTSQRSRIRQDISHDPAVPHEASRLLQLALQHGNQGVLVLDAQLNDVLYQNSR